MALRHLMDIDLTGKEMDLTGLDGSRSGALTNASIVSKPGEAVSTLKWGKGQYDVEHSLIETDGNFLHNLALFPWPCTEHYKTFMDIIFMTTKE